MFSYKRRGLQAKTHRSYCHNHYSSRYVRHTLGISSWRQFSIFHFQNKHYTLQALVLLSYKGSIRILYRAVRDAKERHAEHT